MQPYTSETEEIMRLCHESLNEEDRRRYAGIEALKSGHGGQNHIAKVLGCSRRTVRKGAIEASGLPAHIVAKKIGKFPTESPKIRKKGGGRKPYQIRYPETDEQFLNVVREHTAGNPMDEKVRWTNLREWEIAEAPDKEYGVRVSRNIVRQLLRKHGYRLRKAQKRKPMKKNVPGRNSQSDNILRLGSECQKAGNPVISMDTKKKEYLGNSYREGRLHTSEELQVPDHDFPSFAEGVIIPHCFYDIRLNIGYVRVGTSHDTSEFACDSFRLWWYDYGCRIYPNATSVLVLCDGGGSNSARHYLFKQDLQILADEIGIEIRIAHYPPHCSKSNPIGHLLSPHITRACQGVIFSSSEVVTDLIAKTHTKKGPEVFVHVIDRVYETGRKVAGTSESEMRIVFDKILPRWNYRAIPGNC